jgi:hypothetical protein
VSARKTEFATNAGASVYIWLSNESDAPQHYGVCCELTFLQKIQVFNSSGLPLESAAHKRLRDEGKSDNDLVVACSCSTVLTVEPGEKACLLILDVD